MNISVLCSHCRRTYTVDQSRLGATVACPHCFTPNDVLVVAEVEDEVDISDGEYRLAPDDEGPTNPPVDPVGADYLEAAQAGRKKPATRPSPAPTPATSGPPQAPGAATTVTCDKCKAVLESGALKCSQCGAATKLGRMAGSDDPGAAPIGEPAPGFQGWMESRLSEGESLDSMMLWVQILTGFFLLVFSILWFPWFLILSVPALIAFIVVKVVNVGRKKNGEEPVTWYFLLWFARLTAWGFLKGPFARRKIYNGRGRRLVDSDLETIDGINDLDVLDVEGTQVTDESIDYLARLRNLKFLVVRGTGISQQGYKRLQERLRSTWIWY